MLKKIVIAYITKNFLFAIFEIILLDFENFIISSKNIIISFVLSFSLNHFSLKIGYIVV